MFAKGKRRFGIHSAHFFEIEFTQEVKRKMTLFNVLTVIIYQAETIISVGIVLHFMNARGYVISVSILK